MYHGGGESQEKVKEIKAAIKRVYYGFGAFRPRPSQEGLKDPIDQKHDRKDRASRADHKGKRDRDILMQTIEHSEKLLALILPVDLHVSPRTYNVAR
jgi:hypothetical protein